MLLRKSIFLLSTVCSVWILSNCGNSTKAENALTEGSIEYTASVVDESHPMAGLAPSSATVKFKGNKFQIEMSTMGIFNTVFISNPSKHTLSQMVKFMDIKNACIQTAKDLEKDNEDYDLKFEETKETKKIAGYKCKKLKATMVHDPSVTFDVYYTNDLGLDSINNLGPYKDVHGMLMEYRLKKMGLEMSFTATAVKKEEVKEEVFEIPSYYKIVTRAEMEKMFDELQH